tara:strand:+ start:495 stop:671 length:177 start_codon:yes stop_codon:yes gene_type:complete
MTAVNSITNFEQAKEFIHSMIKTELRCLKCGKLLAKINSNGVLAGQIKCPRCGAMNEV